MTRLRRLSKITCYYCGKVFIPDDRYRKFCSVKCYVKHQKRRVKKYHANMIKTGIKICCRCKQAKPLSHFYRYKSGYQGACRECKLHEYKVKNNSANYEITVADYKKIDSCLKRLQKRFLIKLKPGINYKNMWWHLDKIGGWA